MRSCALPTPDSIMRAVRVPSVSSVERESRALAARPRTPAGACFKRRAATASALGGSFTLNS